MHLRHGVRHKILQDGSEQFQVLRPREGHRLDPRDFRSKNKEQVLTDMFMQKEDLKKSMAFLSPEYVLLQNKEKHKQIENWNKERQMETKALVKLQSTARKNQKQLRQIRPEKVTRVQRDAKRAEKLKKKRRMQDKENQRYLRSLHGKPMFLEEDLPQNLYDNDDLLDQDQNTQSALLLSSGWSDNYIPLDTHSIPSRLKMIREREAGQYKAEQYNTLPIQQQQSYVTHSIPSTLIHNEAVELN